MVKLVVVVMAILYVGISQGVCSDGWVSNSHLCYLTSTSPKSLNDSLADCRRLNARLPEVRSNQSVIMLQQVLGSDFTHQIWTGLVSIRNGTQTNIVDSTGSNVTDCTGCDDIVFPVDVRSSCIVVDLSTGEFDWTFCSNETRHYVCAVESDDTLSVTDVAAIVCAGFLVSCFIVAMVTTVCRKQEEPSVPSSSEEPKTITSIYSNEPQFIFD